MAITRTAKGTAQSKAANPTLTLSSVALNAGDMLVVGLGYETDAAIVSVKWGNRSLKLVTSSGATHGDTRVRLYRARVRNTFVRDVVVTWAANMSARCLFATALTEVSIKDVGSTNTHGSGTTAPTTGAAVTSTDPDTMSIAAFVSEGPSGDTAGTAGVGHTLGQRVGTTGGGASSNVTIQETFELLTVVGNVRATLSGATGRTWATSIVAFRSSEVYTIISAERKLWSGHPASDSVHFRIEDAANVLRFEMSIATEAFLQMTDAEITAVLKSAAAREAEILEGPLGIPSVDTALDTRIATFVNDKLTV